jgi:hypothetical protein
MAHHLLIMRAADAAAKEVSAPGDRPLVLGRRTLLGSGAAAAAAVALGWPTLWATAEAATPASYAVPSNDVVYRPVAGSLAGGKQLLLRARGLLGSPTPDICVARLRISWLNTRSTV